MYIIVVSSMKGHVTHYALESGPFTSKAEAERYALRLETDCTTCKVVELTQLNPAILG